MDFVFGKVENFVCGPDGEMSPSNDLEFANSLVDGPNQQEVDLEEQVKVEDDSLTQQDTKKILWYLEPKYIMLGILCILLIVILIVNGILLILKW